MAGLTDVRGERRDAVGRVQRTSWRLGLLLLAALISQQLPLPWSLAAIPFAGAALVAGVQALRAVSKARSAGVPVGSVAISGLGLALALLSLLGSLRLVVFYDLLSAHEQCVRGANTARAEQRCDETLESALDARLRMGNLTGR